MTAILMNTYFYSRSLEIKIKFILCIQLYSIIMFKRQTTLLIEDQQIKSFRFRILGSLKASNTSTLVFLQFKFSFILSWMLLLSAISSTALMPECNAYFLSCKSQVVKNFFKRTNRRIQTVFPIMTIVDFSMPKKLKDSLNKVIFLNSFITALQIQDIVYICIP